MEGPGGSPFHLAGGGGAEGIEGGGEDLGEYSRAFPNK